MTLRIRDIRPAVWYFDVLPKEWCRNGEGFPGGFASSSAGEMGFPVGMTGCLRFCRGVDVTKSAAVTAFAFIVKEKCAGNAFPG